MMYLGYQDGKIKFYTSEKLDMTLYCLEKLEETEDEYVLSEDGEEYIKKPKNWEEILAQRERKRLDALTLTSADIERALYKAKGMDFDDVIELAKRENEQQTQIQTAAIGEEIPEKIDIKALKIELKANNFYRGNIYLNKVATLLGFSEKQIDNFFQYNDYKYLMDDKGE